MALERLIVEELDKLSEDLPFLECDGMTSVLSFVLHENGIVHQPFGGVLHLSEGMDIQPHLWIQVGDQIIDYRARKYATTFLGITDVSAVPHGIFEASVYPSASYLGATIFMPPDRTLYDLLVQTGTMFDNTF
jgi:hypothetical protein